MKNSTTSFLAFIPFKLIFCIVCQFWILGPVVFAQKESYKTIESVGDVIDNPPVKLLADLSLRDSLNFSKQRDSAIVIARKSNYPIEGSFKNSNYILDGFDDAGQLKYITNYNSISAKAIRVDELYPGGNAGLNLTGNGITLGMWEINRPRISHVELNGRVTQRDNSTRNIDNHSTHVGGTMIGAGINANARGMAYQAHLHAYDIDNYFSEMATAASQGLNISNHSYGAIAGWTHSDHSGEEGWHWWGFTGASQTVDFKFGLYDSDTRKFDEITHNAPFYLPVKAAGNNRTISGPEPGAQHWVWGNGQWVSSTAVREPNGGADGYDCIPTYGCAKNILTVGGLSVEYDGGLESVGLYHFSSWGPTDDGRIKPDVVSRAVNVLSSRSGSDNDYGISSGTSMATPSVAAALGLLMQHYGNLNPGYTMRASALKAVAIHTAKQIDGEGPNYRTGWGRMDTRAAADFIAESLTPNGRDVLVSAETLNNNGVRNFTFYHDGTSEVRITIAWTDPAGPVSANTLNPTQLRLVNDLDVRLIRVSDNQVFMPWILNPGSPAASATKGDNFRDNVEQIYETVLPAGNYTIRITHKNTLQGGSQIFSLMLSGRGTEPVCSIPSGLESFDLGYSNVSLRWSSVNGATGYQTRMRNTSNDWALDIVRPYVGLRWSLLTPATQHEFQTRTQCASGNFSEWSPSHFITTLGQGDPYCYTYGVAWDEWIAGITLGDFNHDSESESGYANFTHLTANLEKSTPINVQLKPGNTGGPVRNVYWRIWIDFNKDNDFNDSGEKVIEMNGLSNATVSGTFLIPALVNSGLTRMRISMSLEGIPEPCQTGNAREVEDYTVNITNILAPVANFSATKTCGQAPLQVGFFDLSGNNPTQWEWDFGNGETSAQKNPQVIYTQPGTYNVTLTATNTGGSNLVAKTAFIIVVNDINVTSSSSTACTGDPITLIASGSEVYEWSGPGLSPGSGNTATANPGIPGTYNYSVTGITNGCSSDPKFISVEFSPVNEFSVSIQPTGCPGPDLEFSSQTLNGGSIYNVKWFRNGQEVWNGPVYRLFSAVNGDEIYCEAITLDPPACLESTLAESQVYVVECIETTSTSVIDLLQSSKLFPNPNNGLFNLEIELEKSLACEMQVYNMLGQLIHANKLYLNQGLNNIPVQLSNSVAGNYILALRSGSEVHHIKFQIY